MSCKTISSQAEKLASKSETDFLRKAGKIWCFPDILAVVTCCWGVSGDADTKTMGTMAELGSFLKGTYLGALGFLTGHFQMVHLNPPFVNTPVQRNLKDASQP